MLGSANSTQNSRFFGLNPAAIGRDILTAWYDMLEWRIFSWLWPKSAVRLWLPTGKHALSSDLHSEPLHNEKLARSARFEALLLPENILLRRALVLPKLQPAELQAALSLESQNLNPFPPGDVAWTYEVEESDNDTLHIQVALTSRKLITQYIEATHPLLNTQIMEVWVSRNNNSGFMMLPGFGDARRQRQSTAWRWASALLALLALILTAAIAATPSIQLYLRAMQARQVMLDLQKKADPVLKQRESLIRTSEKLTDLATLIGKPIPPVQILKLITESLPDDTSLLSLQIQGPNVSITGQTVNAATLMKQLGTTPGLRDVKAPSPAIKPLGAQRESFTIEFTIDQTQLRSLP